MTALSFAVVGAPAPQGSKRHVGRGILVESSKTLAPWRDSIAYAARQAIAAGGPTFPQGPVRITLAFALKRPKSAPKSRQYPDGRPDADKLARAVLDALDVAGVYGDDGQVVQLDVWKRYALPNEPTGVEITASRPGAS